MNAANNQLRGSWAIAFGSGLLFAIGLGLAGMTNPDKVLNFLDVFGDWDPSLMFVMGAGILVYAPVYQLLKGKPKPRLAAKFQWPTRNDVDPKLVVGAILFGIGWGIAGFCPGPAIVAAAAGVAQASAPPIVFFAAMALGMFGFGWVTRWLETRKDDPDA